MGLLERVAFTFYSIKDVARAQKFYEEALGLKLSVKHEAEPGVWIEYDLPGGGCLALGTVAAGVSPSAASGGQIAFEVDNVEEILTKVKEGGGKVNGETLITPGICKMAFIEDTEGNGIIIHQLNDERKKGKQPKETEKVDAPVEKQVAA